MNTLVIDSNIIIASLIKEGFIKKLLTNLKINPVFPEYGIQEIYQYKSEIMKKANINEKEFDIALLRLLKYIRLIPLELIIKFKQEAHNTIGHIHKNDTPFIATALAFNCPIWSDDKHFKEQSKVKVFNKKEIIKLLKQ